MGRLLEIITSTLLHHHSYTPSRRTCWQGLWFFTQLSPSTVFHSHSGRSEPSDPQFPARNLSLKKWLVFCLNTLQGFPHLLKVFNLAYQPQKGLHLLLRGKGGLRTKDTSARFFDQNQIFSKLSGSILLHWVIHLQCSKLASGSSSPSYSTPKFRPTPSPFSPRRRLAAGADFVPATPSSSPRSLLPIFID